MKLTGQVRSLLTVRLTISIVEHSVPVVGLIGADVMAMDDITAIA